MMTQRLSGVAIAERIAYTVVQVSRIRRRFAERSLAGLQDRPKSGRPPTVSARKRAQIVARTLQPPGAGVTHWTTRIWRGPWASRTARFSIRQDRRSDGLPPRGEVSRFR